MGPEDSVGPLCVGPLRIELRQPAASGDRRCEGGDPWRPGRWPVERTISLEFGPLDSRVPQVQDKRDTGDKGVC